MYWKTNNRFKELHIINAYGPTEATSAVCACEITKDMRNQERLPIGVISDGAVLIEIFDQEIVLKRRSVF